MISLREKILRCLIAVPMQLSITEVQHIRITDVTTSERRSSGFLTIKRKLTLPSRVVPLTDEVQRLLDEYVNTDDPDEKLRPFHDYRPNVGYHLFPSAVTGRALSCRAIRTLTASPESRILTQTRREKKSEKKRDIDDDDDNRSTKKRYKGAPAFIEKE